jgi:DNA-binding beta-propeller fold protein YncE
MIVVNLSVPAETESSARMSLRSATAWVSGEPFLAAPRFVEVQSDEIEGRAPRWARFEVSTGVLDSLVLDWARFEVRVDGAWIEPAPPWRSVIPVGRTLNRGDALVVNLVWFPDAVFDEDPSWRPVFEIEEIPEPPLGGRIYVSEEDEGIVSIFERVRGRMVRAIALGGRPRDMTWDPLRQRLYVVVAGRHELVVVDVAGRETIRRVPLGFGADPTRLLLTRDLQRVAVVVPERDVVSVFSTASLQEIVQIRVGQFPVAIVEDVAGGKLYVSCLKSGEVYVLDASTGSILARFQGFESPTELAPLESGLIAVGQDRGSRIHLIDPASGGIQSSLRTCGSVAGLIAVERLDRLYAVDSFCSEIAVFRPRAGLEIASIRLDERVGLPALDSRAVDLILPMPDSRQVALIAVERGDVRLKFDVGGGPWRAISP